MPFRKLNTYGLSIPITKHNFLVSSADQLLDIIPRAFRIAASGRPGPVLVDIPKDVQNQLVEVDRMARAGLCRSRSRRRPPKLVERAAAMINQAVKPILYLGGGVVHSGASRTAVALAEKASLPTVMTLMALGAMAVDHDLSLGMLGMHGARCTQPRARRM